MLIDIGANLSHTDFSNDFDQIIDRANQAEVETIIVTGASLESSRAALMLTRKYKDLLYATAGIHPHHAEQTSSETISALSELLRNKEVVAVGETGLDYFRDFSPRDIQEKSFEAHIELAISQNLPMFLHERDAYRDFVAILQSHYAELGKVVVHCFTGDKKALHHYLDLDCYIGITGWICDERRGQHLLELIKNIPANRLLIETDSPYLLPRNIRPKPKSRRNEPALLPHICRTIAAARGETFESIAEMTTNNAKAFFSL